MSSFLPRLLFLIVLFLSFSVNSISAQIFDRITRSVERAVNNEINKVGDKVAERLVQELIESILSGQESESDSLSMYKQDSIADDDGVDAFKALLGSVTTSSSNEKVDRVFEFDYRLVMSISADDNVNNMTMYFPKEGSYTLVEMASITVITDYETGDSYTILNDKLTTFNMQKVIEKSMTKAVQEDQVYSITKTGNSEKIAGYLCEEYVLESEESKVNSWISTEFVYQDFTSSAMIEKIRSEYDEDLPDGFAMRMISKNKKDGTITKMQVESIENVEKTMDLSQY